MDVKVAPGDCVVTIRLSFKELVAFKHWLYNRLGTCDKSYKAGEAVAGKFNNQLRDFMEAQA